MANLAVWARGLGYKGFIRKTFTRAATGDRIPGSSQLKENLAALARRLFGPANGVDLEIPRGDSGPQRDPPDFSEPDHDPPERSDPLPKASRVEREEAPTNRSPSFSVRGSASSW
jgi:hypothetical protein